MSNEIINTFHKWVERVKNGKKGYELFYLRNGEWRYLAKDCSASINSIDIVLWNDKKIRLLYRWNKEKDMDSGKKMAFIVKDEKQLMFCDGDAGYFAWGLSDKINSTDRAMIFLELGGTETIIALSNDAERITDLYHVLNKETDALMTNWNFLINCISDGKKTESEVKEDAGASKRAMDESYAGWL